MKHAERLEKLISELFELAKLDAEEAHELLYQATEHMCLAVERNRGTVCRIMGDGMMAMFGAPLASERHALEACTAALEMQAAKVNEALESAEFPEMPYSLSVRLDSLFGELRAGASESDR